MGLLWGLAPSALAFLFTRAVLMATLSIGFAMAEKQDVSTIVKRSTETNDRDFAAASKFNYKETDKLRSGSRTIQVTMIDGTPYERVIALNGKPLKDQQKAAEDRKQKEAETQRHNESESARKTRIAKYRRAQERDHEMMSQLSAAFNFAIAGEARVRGFDTWILKATPKPGYQPPTMQAQVLRGMQGEMWIDKKTYEWVKVTAVVTRPVSIEGFLAQVQPGTRFEIEKSPVSQGIWQITHYSSRAQARVLHMFNHNEQDNATYFDYRPADQ